MSSITNTASVVDVASVVSERMIYPCFNSNDSLSSSISSSQSSLSSVMLRPLSREQKYAGEQIINYFNANSLLNRWAILTAQMQSGKTETYLFIAAEMLRLGLIQHFIIFSGNAETALKNQIIEILTDTFPEDMYTEEEQQQKSFMRKYEDYLIDTNTLTTRQILNVLRTLKSKGQKAVVWGNELSKYSGPTTDTLFIWEESHFAQDQDNLPAKMLQRIGFSADGDAALLSDNRNYVVSVSATGFSELSDNLYQTQGKLVQNLEPGAGYNSVEKMMANGRIKSYKTIAKGLDEALSREHANPVYAVVRVTNKNAQEVTQICREKRWNVVSHDSTTESDEGKRTWNNMKNAPLVDTVILLKGLCRMGQNIEKTHVLFCFETSKNSKTDTVLQSFVGRVCGYSTNSENVYVYLPEKTFNNGEISRYVRMSGGEEIMPLKARNLAPLTEKVSTHGLFPIIPLIIKNSDRSNINKDDSSVINADVIARINDDSFENLNTNDLVVDTIKTLLLETPDHVITVRRIVKKNGLQNISQTDMIDNFNTSISTRTPLKYSTIREGTIKKEDGTSAKKDVSKYVNAWIMCNGDIYVDFLAPNCQRMTDVTTDTKVARTTKKEVFCQKLEDGTEQITNGAFSIHLTPMSAHFVDKMSAELSEIVKLSLTLTNVTTTRKINSVKDSTYKGISLSAQVLESLKPGGTIYENIKTTHGVSLKIAKSRAAITSAHNLLGVTRIASISW